MIHRWLAAGTIRQGNLHVRDGIPNQDFISISMNNGVICGALADGAGSKKLSDRGAQTVTKGITDLFTNNPELMNNDNLDMIVSSIRTRIDAVLEHLANHYQVSKSEFSSTLLFVAISGKKYLSGHLGDGVIAYISRGIAETHSHPEHGEYINETYMTTGRNWHEHLRMQIGTTKKITNFILMSDGTAESIYQRKTKKIAPALLQLAKWMKHKTSREIEEIIGSNLEKQFMKRTNDDVSILFLTSSKHKRDSLNKMPIKYAKEYLGVRRSDGLSNRLKIIMCIEAGMSLKEISANLAISSRCVYRHLHEMKNLGITIQ